MEHELFKEYYNGFAQDEYCSWLLFVSLEQYKVARGKNEQLSNVENGSKAERSFSARSS